MSTIKQLLDNNKAWAENLTRQTPDFFSRLAAQQSPEYLWIGCSDSRVPANEIVDLLPGEIFVHRNIANVVVHTDLNCLSVIQYAVEVLNVKHIIVCGHYGCGGIKAALENAEHGLIDNWLRHIKDVHRHYEDEIERESDPEKRCSLLCEKNVIEQVANVCHTTIVQNAWKSGKNLSVHGWVYGIENGRIKDLEVRTSGLDQLRATHQLK
ncbi:MAG: carbonate dehydratase [Gammaproteobacteria bacterium]|nr:MAG: carbonate dehydratase [Gammaproteobacteria bacterium]